VLQPIVVSVTDQVADRIVLSALLRKNPSCMPGRSCDEFLDKLTSPLQRLTYELIQAILSPMEALLNIVSKPFSGLVAQLSKERRVEIHGFSGSAKQLLAGYTFRALGRPVLYIADGDDEGSKARDDLAIILGETISYLPAWGIVPSGRDSAPTSGQRDSYESPEVEIVRQRMETLWGLSTRTSTVTVATADGFTQLVVPKKTLNKATISLHLGANVDRDRLAERLLLLGFESVDMVEDIGQFSVRGGIIDVFPFGSKNPVRIELFGDTIQSLRSFDVPTQRSRGLIDSTTILPYRELCLTPEIYRRALKVVEDPLEEGSERYLKIIHKRLAKVIDYLADETVVFLDSSRKIHISHDVIIFVPAQDLHIKPHPVYSGNLKLFKEDVRRYRQMEYHTFLLVDGEKQRDRFSDIISGDLPDLSILPFSLHEGFVYPEVKLACFTDHQIFQRSKLRPRRKFSGGIPIDDILSLKKGDICVHVDYGVGRFDGMKRITVDGLDTDCLALSYRDGDRLYVPTHQMYRVQRYIGGSGVAPQLTKLGSGSWDRVRRRTRKAVEDLTKELLHIYAARHAQIGYAFAKDTIWQKELESSFLFDETPDQLKAVEAIKDDMESPKPMDRLVCGEVGYGKTEVAIRGAFKAVMDGRQVAVLVPTTILAQQHYNSFTQRMKDFPVEVEMLSRLRTSKENKRTIERLKGGTIDVVIGTHRLLSADVDFRNLGLLIIDEEQRFGVKHKEKIKKLRRLVDCITMSATPIPRTLYMSLISIRDMTTIETPPPDRLSVVTEVCRWNDELIVEACLREVERGGQVFFVHNRVETIYSMAEYLRKLLPELRIEIAHGKLPTSRLEKIMIDFLGKKFDLLLTTAIVESGVDVPNANTIIVNRADRFGLAQLHQLRGRVGRSDRRAYCYFLTPRRRKMTDDAQRRLRAIRTFSELGSGFQLALRDLEIRGAGNILGAEQHGHISAVGFELYSKLLQQAIAEMKGEKIAAPREPKISLNLDLFIPEDYVPHEEQRIAIYKKLGDAKDERALEEVRAEMEDRFGSIPSNVENLLDAVRIKLAAVKAGVECVLLRNGIATIEFRKGRHLPKDVLKKVVEYPVEFVQEERLGIRLKTPGERLGILTEFLLMVGRKTPSAPQHRNS